MTGEVSVCAMVEFDVSITYGNDRGEEGESAKSPEVERFVLEIHPRGMSGGEDESKFSLKPTKEFCENAADTTASRQTRSLNMAGLQDGGM
jgi:hypothetical protein